MKRASSLWFLRTNWSLGPTLSGAVLVLLATSCLLLFLTCKKDEATSPNTVSGMPVVRLLSPANNAQVSDTTTIEVEVADDKGVVKVEIYIDNALVRTFVVSPYKHTWMTSGLTDSSYHIVYAKGYDADGNVGSSSVATVRVVHQRPGSPSNIVFPTSNVSYSQHVQPLFNQACAFAGCHDAGTHQSPLRLTSWGDVVITIPGIVVTGQPDQSTLVFRIEGRVGQRMPLNLNPLNQNQINGVRTWIAEGARNN